MATLQEQVLEVARLRGMLAFNQGIISRDRKRWDEEHQEDLIALKESQDAVAKAEAALREATLIAYKETGNKAPAPGVAVRKITVLDYAPSEALAWAVKHSLALTLDKKAFETIAKHGRVPFVRIGLEPQATITTDLEKVLAEVK